MPAALADLDELILRCRDPKARLYIEEAIASYRAGAIRSSIVTCWIATCFDVIEKLHELALAGDKAAEKHVQELENSRRSNDIARALKFERELLVVARDEFELISPLEFTDLARLQEDRNRCAHPSLSVDGQAYSPSAELARLHIHSVVVHLLQHPPAQGKYALDRLLKEVESEYFPTDAKKAEIAFSSGPLKRPRESLVRNFVILLVKSALSPESDYKRRLRFASAINAVRLHHSAIYFSTLRVRLPDLLRAIPDSSILRIVYFLRITRDSWQFLPPDVTQRLESYVQDLPVADLDEIDFLLEYEPLKSHAIYRVARMTREEIASVLFFATPVEVCDRIIEIFLESRSFDDANATAKDMPAHSMDFSPAQIRRLLMAANQNPQVRGSFQLASLIENLRGRKKIAEHEFERLLRENGLGQFAKD